MASPDLLGASLEALGALAAAALVTFAATPLAIRVARRYNLVAEPSERGLHTTPTPYLGGTAMLLGALVAAAIFLPGDPEIRAIMGGCIAIVVIGVVDDIFDLHPAIKLLGQIGAALIPVLLGVRVEEITLPLIGNIQFGDASIPLTVFGMVATMNVVNFSDGIDGLAAGICAIAAVTFAIIAMSFLHDPRVNASILAAVTAGVCLGFLPHNFNPAKTFMGDSGSNLLGLLLAAVAVEGLLKTTAILALLLPLALLAVPILDTGVVVARRIKNRTPFYRADREHFHHRLAAIGFSQRRTVLYLYAWSGTLAVFALALHLVQDRFTGIPPAFLVLLTVLGAIALAATVYVVRLLKIFDFGSRRQLGELEE